MGGIYGVVSKEDCILDLFYGTDYHSHLGTSRGGLAVLGDDHFIRSIHNIENSQFRSKFEHELEHMGGNLGIGCISDTESQPLIIRSHLGHYAITTVGRINNTPELAQRIFDKQSTHFLEMSGGEINPTEMAATLIDQGKTFGEGIQNAQESIDGSCTMLLATQEGLYAARDRLGRTPLIIGEKRVGEETHAYCATMETCALPNMGYRFKHELGPGEIVLITPEGIEQKKGPGDMMRICAFLWVYYGYPASSYEGINVEAMRYRSGRILARRDEIEVDLVAGIPDSGTAHAIGYANEAQVPYGRPFVKYTPTWPRSFMPQVQETRNLVARMKLIPINDLIHGKRLLFCEDSIVRGTQLRETIQRLYDDGAREIHVRPACPPLIYSCPYLNFSRSRSAMDLAARRAIRELEGHNDIPLDRYADPATDHYHAMVSRIQRRLNLTSLKYQALPDMVEAIGLPREKVCTYCWNRVG